MATCQSFVLLASAARTALTTGADIASDAADGVRVIMDCTAVVSTPSVGVVIQGKDPISGKYYTMLTGTAVTGTGTNIFTIYPSITSVSGVSTPNVMPSVFRINTTVADTNSMTYSINYELIRYNG